MLRQPSTSVTLLFAVLALSDCSKTTSAPSYSDPASNATPATNAPATSVRFVKASTTPVQIPVGASAEAIVRVAVQDGYHINANPPTFPYLKAAELAVQAGDGLSVGFIKYPTSITKKFSFAEKPLAVYEGEALITIMLKAVASTPKGTRTLPTKLNVQACDDQVCYPPGTIDLAISVTIQ